jgi:hypothetical protein
MKEIFNATEHEIVFYSEDDVYPASNGRKFILKERARPIAVIPAGIALNCKKTNLPAPAFSAGDVPLKGAVVFESCDPLPPDAEGKIVVVSAMYRAACKELGLPTDMLATIDIPVYASQDDIRPVGCLGLAVG